LAVVSNASVASGSTLNQDVDTAQASQLSVLGVVGPTATAAGDVSIAVFPYRESATGVSTAPVLGIAAIPALAAGAAVLGGNLAELAQSFNVAGYAKVQIQVKNNNVGALPVEIDYGINPLE
jgi:hypothetical protein